MAETNPSDLSQEQRTSPIDTPNATELDRFTLVLRTGSHYTNPTRTFWCCAVFALEMP